MRCKHPIHNDARAALRNDPLCEDSQCVVQPNQDDSAFPPAWRPTDLSPLHLLPVAKLQLERQRCARTNSLLGLKRVHVPMVVVGKNLGASGAAAFSLHPRPVLHRPAGNPDLEGASEPPHPLCASHWCPWKHTLRHGRRQLGASDIGEVLAFIQGRGRMLSCKQR